MRQLKGKRHSPNSVGMGSKKLLPPSWVRDVALAAALAWPKLCAAAGPDTSRARRATTASLADILVQVIWNIDGWGY